MDFLFVPVAMDLVYFSFNDFHWVPAGFIILRVVLIVIYNYSLDYGSRCMMQLVAVVVTAALIAIYRPYKSGWINSLDTCHLSRPWIAYCFKQLPVSSN